MRRRANKKIEKRDLARADKKFKKWDQESVGTPPPPSPSLRGDPRDIDSFSVEGLLYRFQTKLIMEVVMSLNLLSFLFSNMVISNQDRHSYGPV